MARAPRTRGMALGSVEPQLFLSHSSKDHEFVSRLARDLNVCGIDVWFDTWELRTGVDLHERISDAVAKSKFVAILVSCHFDSSKWIKGEVHQALSREMAEDRTVVLPLLVDDAPLPAVLSGKLCLDLTSDCYFPALARLSGLIHDLDSESIENAITILSPDNIGGCIRALRYCGFHPYCVVGTRTLDEIEAAGGSRSGDRIRFDPEEIRGHPTASPALRELMERLITTWGD